MSPASGISSTGARTAPPVSLHDPQALPQQAAKAVLLLDMIANTEAIADKQSRAREAGWEAGHCSAGAAALRSRARAQALVAVGRSLRHVHGLGCNRLGRGADGALVAWRASTALRGKAGQTDVVAADFCLPAAGSTTTRSALEVLGVRAASLDGRAGGCVASLGWGRPNVQAVLQRATEALQDLLDGAPRRVQVLDGVAGFQPLQGLDLRGAALPPNLARGTLERVNLAGEDLTGGPLHGGTFRAVDLRGALLPADLRGTRVFDCDLRGATVLAHAAVRAGDWKAAPADACTAWPDFSPARLDGAVLDFQGIVEQAARDGQQAVGVLLDATTFEPQRSLLRSIDSISDPAVRRDAMERLLSAVHALDALPAVVDGAGPGAWPAASAAAAPDRERLHFIASLAALLFNPVYSAADDGTPGIARLRVELASALAENALYFSAVIEPGRPATGNAAALAALAIHQPAFPPAMRALALINNPALGW